MKRIEINAFQPYPVLADRCFLSEAGTLIRRCAEDAGKAAVVTDDIVDRYRTDMTRAEGEAVGEDVVRNVIRMTRDFVDGYYFSIPFNRVYMLKEILPEI